MAWLYADFEAEGSDAERVAKLRLHLGEVSLEIGANLSIANRSRDNGPLVTYREGLIRRLHELDRVASAAGGGQFIKCRPV